MNRTNLIVLTILYAGIAWAAPAQTEYISENARILNPGHSVTGPADPGRKKKNRKNPVSGGENRDTKKSYDLDPIPVPDHSLTFTREKYILPAYLSTEEGYKIDCLYINTYDYFSIWDNNKLNPYGFNGEHFTDTLQLILFNPKDSILWHSPLDETIVTSDFGLRRASWHYGIDFRVKVGTPIYAAFDGIVRVIGYERRGFGRYLVIRLANGLESVYAHMSKTFYSLGETVKAGEVIGSGGNSGRSTAPHLHFELRFSGNAIDPNLVYDFKANQIRDQKFIVNPNVFTYLSEANKIRYHTVRSGDTLSEIGYRYGVSINKLCLLNGLRRTSILRIGQRLRVN